MSQQQRRKEAELREAGELLKTRNLKPNYKVTAVAVAFASFFFSRKSVTAAVVVTAYRTTKYMENGSKHQRSSHCRV
jgi:hypothetical protein